MQKSPGRIARPLCLLLALGFCVATVIALVIGATRRGEVGAIGLQMAFSLAVLALVWALIGIMFTVAKPRAAVVREPHGEPGPRAQRHGSADEPRRNWFQDATSARSSRR